MFGIDFKSLRKSVDSLEKRLQAMRTEVEELRRQRERVQHAPVHKDDLKALLGNWLAANGERYQQSLRETLAKFVRSPRYMTQHELDQAMSLSGALQPFAGDTARIGPKDIDQALCGLFAPLLKDALMKEIDSMEWSPSAISTAERTVTVDQLTEQIERLDRDIATLINEAEEAGIHWNR
jgi:chaperonin cofactor prefoldin